jgi:hypothetical protein
MEGGRGSCCWLRLLRKMEGGCVTGAGKVPSHVAVQAQ